jgi:hypothetical protein
MPLDSNILPLIGLQTIRTTFIVDLATPTPRKFTNYPGGITVPNILGTLTLTSGGSAYTAPPRVAFSGGGGQGAAALAIISGGVVTGLLIVSRGWGYTSAPAVTFSSGSAAATAALSATFSYADFTIAAVQESADGSTPIEAALTITNTDNAYTDLVTNSVNVLAPVSIQKVWRNSSDAVVSTEIWLEGHTGKPHFVGEKIDVACHAYLGRRGNSPRTQWSDVLVTHLPIPAGTKIPWLTRG